MHRSCEAQEDAVDLLVRDSIRESWLTYSGNLNSHLIWAISSQLSIACISYAELVSIVINVWHQILLSDRYSHWILLNVQFLFTFLKMNWNTTQCSIGLISSPSFQSIFDNLCSYLPSSSFSFIAFLRLNNIGLKTRIVGSVNISFKPYVAFLRATACWSGQLLTT